MLSAPLFLAGKKGEDRRIELVSALEEI